MLAIACISISSWAQAPRPEKQQGQTKKQETGPRNTTGTSEFGAVSQITTVTEAPRAKDKPKDWHEWFWPPVWSNWALVAIGGIAALAAFRTLAVIRRQANAMERQTKVLEDQTAAVQTSAIASKQSAETAKVSLEMSQRAIVVLDSIGLKNNAIQTHGPELNYFRHGFIDIVFKNEGPTEANGFYYTIAPRIVGINGPSEVEAIVSHRTVLQRGKSLKENLPTFDTLFRDGEIASVLMGTANLEVNGFVRYRDAFDRGWYVGFASVLDWKERQFRTTMQIWEEGKQPPENWIAKPKEQN